MRTRPYEIRSLTGECKPYIRRYKAITVYSVTRHCGGSEEGGWWYDWFTFVASFPIPRTLRKKRNWRKLNTMFEGIQRRFLEIQRGDRFSVLGGTGLSVRLEMHPREDESKHTPHYE